MSGSITAPKTPYSRTEDKLLVEFVRANNGWHRVRGKTFWEKEFCNVKGLRRSPHSARERFLKRIMNFEASPSNRKLFTTEEIKLLENNYIDEDGIKTTSCVSVPDPILRLSCSSASPKKKISSSFSQSNFLTQNYIDTTDKVKQSRISNLTTELAVQYYKKVLAIESLKNEDGLEHAIIMTLETIIFSFEILLREIGCDPNSIQAQNKTPVEKFEYLVNHELTGHELIDRLPGTLITLVFIAKEICFDQRNTMSAN